MNERCPRSPAENSARTRRRKYVSCGDLSRLSTSTAPNLYVLTPSFDSCVSTTFTPLEAFPVPFPSGAASSFGAGTGASAPGAGAWVAAGAGRGFSATAELERSTAAATRRGPGEGRRNRDSLEGDDMDAELKA